MANLRTGFDPDIAITTSRLRLATRPRNGAASAPAPPSAATVVPAPETPVGMRVQPHGLKGRLAFHVYHLFDSVLGPTIRRVRRFFTSEFRSEFFLHSNHVSGELASIQSTLDAIGEAALRADQIARTSQAGAATVVSSLEGFRGTLQRTDELLRRQLAAIERTEVELREHRQVQMAISEKQDIIESALARIDFLT